MTPGGIEQAGTRHSFFSRLFRLMAASMIAGLGLAGCSDDDPEASPDTTTTSTTTTAPIPTPGGQDVQDLDACDLVSDERIAAYLSEIRAPAAVSTSASTSEFASVCGWFVEDREVVERPEMVLLRVEPIQVGGNVVCDTPDDARTDELDVAGSGWVTLEAPIAAASTSDEWCAYLAAPATPRVEVDLLRAATTELLAEVQASLPR